MPKKGKKLDESQVQQHMEAYSEATVSTLLDSAFGGWDVCLDERHVPILNRNDHIIIGGRTASDLLAEKFNREFASMRRDDGRTYADGERAIAYGHFVQGEGKRFINQTIASALATGEKVEAFVPDKATGRIKEQPMALTHRGYEPAGPLVKPKQLNGWQKFWNRFGFYKKEKAAVVNFENEKSARQKVQFCNKAARAVLCTNLAMSQFYREEMDKYHPEIREDMEKNFPHAKGNPASMGSKDGFRTVRASFYSTMMCVLVTKRDKDRKPLYTSDQIFDMADPAMQEARAGALKELYEHYKAGDTDWLVGLQRDAAGVLRDRINEEAGKLDFSKPDLTEQKAYRAYAMLSNTAFDQSQDMILSKERMDELFGKGAYWDAAGKVGDCTQASQHFMDSMLYQKYLINGIMGNSRDQTTEAVAKVLKGQLYQQHIGEEMKKPGRKFSDVVNEQMVNQVAEVQHQAGYEDDMVKAYEKKEGDIPEVMKNTVSLADERLANPKKFDEQIQSGVFERRFQLREFSLDPKAEEPAHFTIRPAAEVEREMTRQTAGGAAL